MRNRGWVLLGLILMAGSSVTAQEITWRFGFEDTFSQFGDLLTEPQAHDLLDKLEVLVEVQQAGGDININGMAGGWGSMQPLAFSPINFDKSDALVRLLQSHGFSVLWNLRINALWAIQDNDGCYHKNLISDCAPDAAHEDDLYDYIYAVVERYDGDGVEDMGHETPDDLTDDLRIPIQFYLMTGEIEFAGATPGPGPDEGYGDAARRHFWTDTIDNLLRTHRIVYRAIHDADPTGFSKLVSSGGVFWDLYTDFPDWPEIEGPTVQARLNGENNHGAVYVESFNRLKQMLTSFGDDSDGVECDYIGWHPHTPWREIEQAFTFIRAYAGDKPIYIDDMWANIALQDREDAPGNTQFYPGGKAMEGDFPNELLADYTELRRGVIFNQIPGARDWYHARHSRQMVKAFASAFGEGAERVSLSGTADFALDRLGLTAFINLMGTLGEGFPEKPGYYTYKLLVEQLHDFTDVQELDAGTSPLTRVYRFERPTRGPVYIAWSETGDAPPGLDYSIPTGETVSLSLESDTLRVTHVVSEPTETEPETEFLMAPDSNLTLQLGYAPLFIEPVTATQVAVEEDHPARHAPLLSHNFPNPFTEQTTIAYQITRPGRVHLAVFDLLGRQVQVLVDREQTVGRYAAIWDGRSAPGGIYVYRLSVDGHAETQTFVLLR